MESERGVEFDTGDCFYRRESTAARDLAVLAAALHRRRRRDGGSELRVLDAMCGCGVRALRYLAQAGADFVWANDAFEGVRPFVLANLAKEPRAVDDRRRWAVSHLDAGRLLADFHIREEFFDLIDVDSFGSESSYLRLALCALRVGGLLYVTSTDGTSSGGHQPTCSLASYGAYIRPMPYSNEVGLRMLIGGVAREAAALGFHISPVFSYYLYHGPVFRVMLRLGYGRKSNIRHHGFLGYCTDCGHSEVFSWDRLGRISCRCKNGKVSNSLVVSGPLWTGPLHDGVYVSEMLDLAVEWGWAETREHGVNLGKVLGILIEESDSQLPPGYIKIDEISRRAKVDSPPLATLIERIRQENYVASRSHIAPNAIKTNCPMAVCLEIAATIRSAK